MKDTRSDDAAAWGLDDYAPDDVEPEHCGVWPEHWPALQLFLAVQTQWRLAVGMGGAHYQGLDYSAVYNHPRLARLDYDQQDERLERLRHIEAGALEVLNKR